MPALGPYTSLLRRFGGRPPTIQASNPTRSQPHMERGRETAVRLPNLNNRWPDFDALVVPPPGATPPHGGLVVLSDVFGHNTEPMRTQAHRLAAHGFCCIIPDLFNGTPWPTDKPASSPDFETWRSRQARPYERIWDIGDTCRHHLAEEMKVGSCGAVGYCIGGGRLVEVLARDGEGKYAAGVSFYGTRIDPEAVDGLSAPVLFVFGELDPLVPREAVEDVARGVGRQAEGRRGRVEVFAGEGHGFVHDGARREGEGAKRAVELAVEWLRRYMPEREG